MAVNGPLRLEARFVASLVMAVSLGALAAAYIAQFGFGLQPCVLCLYQRVPYAVTAALGGIATLPALVGRARLALLTAAGLVFLAGAGIAAYHVGVERHWWAGTAACGGSGLAAPATVADLQRLMSEPPAVACDRPAWMLFGITMAGYNAALSLSLGIATLAAARILWRRESR